MKITISGNAATIVSRLLYAAIENAGQHYPSLLTLSDSNGDPTFRIDTGLEASLSESGCVFTTETKDGYACLTLIGEGLNEGDMAGWLRDEYGVALANLMDTEPLYVKAFTRIDKKLNAVMDIIDGNGSAGITPPSTVTAPKVQCGVIQMSKADFKEMVKTVFDEIGSDIEGDVEFSIQEADEPEDDDEDTEDAED